MQAIWLVLYLAVLFFLITEGHGAWALILHEWPFLPLLAVALFSIAWSDAPGLTARRSLALLPTTGAGLYLAIRYNFAQQIRLLMTVLKISIVLSFIFGVLHLGRAVDNLPGSWYGIFTQRNSLGVIMALGILVFFLWSLVEPEERWNAYGWMLLSFMLLLLSGSMTGLLGSCLVMLCFLFLRQIRFAPSSRRQTICVAALAAGLGLYYIATHFTTVVEAFDRDVTLTGRTTIWGASLLLGMDRAWVGHGFNAFWLGDQGPSGEIRRLAGWDVPGAHNGFLEIWLDLGLLGLALLLLGLARQAWKSMAYFLEQNCWGAGWPILFLAFLFSVNLAQSALLSPNYIFWILYTAVSYRVCLMTAKRTEGAAA